jgi:ZIP family zinc transporter
MAVGVAFAGSDTANAITLATGIGLQNLPEGLAVAASLLAINYSRRFAFIIAALTGLVEPIGGLIGASLGIISVAMLPCMLGLAAGAMLFVISHEIIPETHRRGYEHLATFSLIGGFVLMMLLDATLS